MSTATKLTYLNETKAQLKDTINLTGANITNDTFRSYPSKLYKKLLDAVVDSEELYENLPKVNGTGTDITLNNTDECKIKFNMLGGNTTQGENPSPSNPQEIRNAGIESYNLIDFNNIDGIAITDTKYSFKNYILNVKSTTNTYRSIYWNITDLFKANTGKSLRFCYRDIDISNQYGSIAQLSIYYNDTTPTSQYGLLFHNLTQSNYTIPNDISNISDVLFRIYTNNSNTSQEASVTIKEPMLIFGTEDKPYQPYGYFATIISHKTNLFDGLLESGIYDNSTGLKVDSTVAVRSVNTIKVKANTKYTVTETNNKSIYIHEYDANMQQLSIDTRLDTPKTFTTSSNTKYITFNTRGSESIKNTHIKVQLEEGSSPTTFSNYAQTKRIDLNIYNNVGNVIGHRDFAKIGDYRNHFRKSSGKNLLKNNAKSNTLYNVAFTVDSGGVVSTKGTATANCWYTINEIPLSAGTYTVSGCPSGGTSGGTYKFLVYNVTTGTNLDSDMGNGMTFTAVEGNIYRFQVVIYNGQNADGLVFKPQLELGSTKTSFEPYGTNWYYKKEVNKIVLDGSEGWSNRAIPGDDYVSVKMTLSNDANNCLCDNFTYNSNYDIQTEHFLVSKSWQELSFAILKSRLSTADFRGFKEWLSTHNTTVYYIPATPAYEIITNENVINSLEDIVNSYEDETHIISVDDIPMYLDVSAVRKYS